MAAKRRVIHSPLFERRYYSMAAYYRRQAGPDVAARFAERVDTAIEFIARHPRACAPYEIMRGQQIRKWPTKNFPALIFFSIDDNGDITLESVYGQSQNIAARLPHDMD